MDDATASDNCGEVTIEVSSETTAGDAAGNYTSFARSRLASRCWKQQLRPPTITIQDTTALGSPSSLPTTPSSVQTRCQWTTLWRPTTAVRSPSRCQAKPLRAMPPATTPLFARSLQPTMLETALASQTITVQDTTAPEFTSSLLTTPWRCSNEMPMDDATASDNCGEGDDRVSRIRPAMLPATT